MALITAHLNAGHSGGDSVAIGIYSPSSPSSIPPFSPSLISLMVSVDVKHHVYLLTESSQLRNCVKVQVDDLPSLSLIVHTLSVDVKQL